ncbi:hypothetical protein K501DRAFT_149401, partial [Backusella circina FSU 941]
PPYVCTVYKMGFLKVKMETSCLGTALKNKSWKTMYFELRGTLLKVFLSPDCKYPEFSCSMFKAKCGIAADYYRYKHVIRLRLGSREQYLLRPVDSGLLDVISWLEHFQSATNISPDIDRRKMLHVYTL